MVCSIVTAVDEVESDIGGWAVSTSDLAFDGIERIIIPVLGASFHIEEGLMMDAWRELAPRKAGEMCDGSDGFGVIGFEI